MHTGSILVVSCTNPDGQQWYALFSSLLPASLSALTSFGINVSGITGSYEPITWPFASYLFAYVSL